MKKITLLSNLTLVALAASASAATINVESHTNFTTATVAGPPVTQAAASNSTSSNGIVSTLALSYNGATSGTITYTLTGVNLAAEGGTANETISIVLNVSSTGGNLNENFNVISVGGGALGPGESVTVTGGSVTSATFGGTLSFTGFTNMQTDSLAASERMNLTTGGVTTNNIPGTAAQFDDFGFAASNSITVTGNTGAFYVSGLDFSINAVPEPSSTALLGLAGLGLILRRRR